MRATAARTDKGRRRRLRITAVLCSALGPFCAAQVRAALTPPLAEGSTAVPYPDGASGDADVLLELVVEADGAVSSVAVIDGDQPFADRARAAASTWRFIPAQRDGAGVSARIRARVTFRQERPPVAPDVPAVGATGTVAEAKHAPAEAAPLDAEAPLEVTVRGRRRDAGQTVLSEADIRALPGAFGDPFRAIEALPGVLPLVSGMPYFFVRGAPPNDNGYYVDGIRVPLLFHIGIGQGVIHPALIDRVDFFPGAAPAAQGGVAGAIIAGQTKDPAPALHGEANLRLVDAGALVESPLANNRGSVLVAGRYGYPGPILGAITSGLSLSYWDYQARATWRLTDRDTLGLFAFGSHDYLATASPSADPTAKPIEQFLSDFHRLDLRYDHALADGRVRVAVTGGHDRQGAAPTYITDNSVTARLEVEARLSPALRLRTGASGRLDAYGFAQAPTGPNDPPVPSTADPPPTNLTGSAYADVTWLVSPRLEVTPGARFELFTSSRASAPGAATQTHTAVPAFDPRLSARLTVTSAVALISALGSSHQYPALRVGSLPAPIVTVPGFPIGERQLQTALQVSQGVEVGLPADVVVTATGFLARWSGLTDMTASCVQISDGMTDQAPPYVCPDSRPITGHAYGLEVLARRPLSKRLSGWLSYTLSRSIRDARFVTTAGGVNLATVPADADRTHVLNAIIAYQLGARWRVGGRAIFYTGTPYSALDGALPAPPYNSYRTPSFFRLDVRLERSWSLGKSGSMALVIEGQNVTLSSETSSAFLNCMDSPGMPTRCKYGRVGPITIPSVGMEAHF